MIDRGLAKRKRSVRREQSKEATAARLRRKRERHCFWTHPWGHVYTWNLECRQRRCVGCNRLYRRYS